MKVDITFFKTSNFQDSDGDDNEGAEPLADLEDIGIMMKGEVIYFLPITTYNQSTTKKKKPLPKKKKEPKIEEDSSSEDDEDTAKDGIVREMLTPSLRFINSIN